MKNGFPGYYRPTPEEFDAIWRTCIVCVDANVLLNMYAYSVASRDQLLSLFEGLKDRMRMPHQFAMEYQRNRAKAIMEQVKNCAYVERQMRDLFEQQFQRKVKHPFLSDEMMTNFNKIRDDLAASRKSLEELFSSDPYHERVTSLLAGKVGKEPTAEELKVFHEKAQSRYTARIPPGYEDLKEKGEPDAYGDYVGWVQVMALAKDAAAPAILVTDDSKADWWHIQSERTIGPRPELLAEFRREVDRAFYMYTTPQFMKYAAKALERGVDDGSIQEVRSKLEEQQRSATEMKAVPADAKGGPKSESGSQVERPSPDKPDIPAESDGSTGKGTS
jgi:hypothetical protein